MSVTKTALQLDYLYYGNQLEKQNPQLNFKNHCYWRIANDNACSAKWTTKVKTPYYKNASNERLEKSVAYLKAMINDSSTINKLNKQSLKLRGK